MAKIDTRARDTSATTKLRKSTVADIPKDTPADGQLRILFVPWDRYPPFRPAAKSIFLHELPQRGHRIDWLIQADEGCPEAATIKIKGGFAYIGATDPGRSFFSRIRKHCLNFLNACRMVPLVRRNRYDIIQAKDNFSAAIIALIVARVFRIRFFYWIAYPRAESSIYEGKARISRYPLLYRIRGHVLEVLLYRIILPWSDHIFVQSEQMKKDIAVRGIPLNKMTPVASAVDLARIPYLATSEDQKSVEKGSDEWVVYLGTLKRVRKLDFMIRSFALVLAEEPNAKLIVIGKGDQEADVQGLRLEAERLGITEAVKFTGFVDMADAWEFVRHAAVCLSPYFPTEILRSTSPTKLVEYMAMGKPVVANDHPEQSVVIRESKAGLCTPWDEQAFADAIVSILGDPDQAAQMGVRGRRYVEEFRTNRVMGDLVENTYRRFVRRSETHLSHNK